MEIINVGIRISDKDFALALAKGLALESRKMQFSVVDHNLEDFDIVLTDSEPECSAEVYLSDNRETDVFLQEEPYSVYKYTDSSKIVNSLYYIYFRLTGKTVIHEEIRKCHLIMGVSVSGGNGLSTILVETGKMLFHIYGSRCLIFSLCPCNSSIDVTYKSGNGSYLKLLYYLQGKRNFPIGIFIKEGEDVDYLATEIFNRDYMEITGELLKKLVDKLDSDGRYDFLIVDAGNHFLKDFEKIADLSEGVVFVRNQFEDNEYECFRNIINKEICEIVTDSDFTCSNDFNADNGSMTAEFHYKYGCEARRVTEWIGENVNYEKSE